MNYYERHLGDYARDTGHLSMLEHGAYSLLLDRYYSTEAPIPAESVHRLARARSPEEIAAVDAVLAEFFQLVDGAWVNRRAQAEIAKFQELEPEREAKRENAKERQRRARIRRKELFDALREFGIVPRYDAPTSELESILSRQQSQPVTRDVPVTISTVECDDTATQPQTQTHIEDQKLSLSKPSASDRAERLAQVTEDAIETFNAAPFVKSQGGNVPNVSPIGRDKRRQQVNRCSQTARDIVRVLGLPGVNRDFWEAYWQTVDADPFCSGRQAGTGAHANWVPDFEYLTRPATMAKLFDKAAS